MTAPALLASIVKALRQNEIPFMLTGSFAAAVHGAGRATMDIDFVIDPTSAALESFLECMLNDGRYVSPDAAREALASRLMFNVVDVESSWKIDLMIRKNRPFSLSEFDRRIEVTLGELLLPVVSVEDLVLAKLEWARLGGSDRQVEDAASLIRLAGPALDQRYIDQWSETLDVVAEWSALREAICR